MALNQRKYEKAHTDILRDIRPLTVRIQDALLGPKMAGSLFFLMAAAIYLSDTSPFMRWAILYSDFIFVIFCIYFIALRRADRTLVFKMPYGAKWKDKNNMGPGKSGEAEGILYVGNGRDSSEELWFSNSDARTHILYLGTTGAGKTEGLKSMVTNAMAWASGFVYVDGKADTDLWSSLSSLVRRFGRDDDLLVLNYMTGNSDSRAPSNTMNPFSSGSASYLVNMLVSLMPDAGGDNAMWKERAVALLSSLMPVLTYRRDKLDIPMSVTSIREFMNLDKIIMLSRDETIPEDMRQSLKGYLDELPGYIDAAFDDQGKEKPPGPDTPAYDTTTPRQQHGYLSMQFTRSLQSLGDDYGYIFETQAADVDMVDVVLNRRILVVLIPALEKSGDETANLGKIVAATMKGMMGSALGATVEGEASTVIENKPTQSSTPFMTVFDEVGYYTAEGMAVMAAQARSLGFCLVFSAQDLAALEKRVKEEARSITANCNIKIFGKLEDPTQTKEFFEKTVGEAFVFETQGYKFSEGEFGSFMDTGQAGLQLRSRASYSGLKDYKEGEALVCFGNALIDAQMFYSNPGHAKAMRVSRFVPLPPPDEELIKNASVVRDVRDKMMHKTWTALKADVAVETPEEITALVETYAAMEEYGKGPIACGQGALVGVHALENPVSPLPEGGESTGTASGGETPAPAAQTTPAAPETPKPAEPQTPPADPANPMSFFSAKKTGDSAQQEQAAPPPTTPAEATPPAEKQEPVATAPSGDTGNPMSFFAKKESGSAAPATTPETPKQPEVTLPADVENTLRDAGQDAAAKLFSKGKSDDTAQN